MGGMSASDLVIRSRRVIAGGRAAPAAVHVTKGRITEVAAFEDIRDPGQLIDCGDDVVMAGLVDSHVHVNAPGRTEWEGFDSATRAAAAGGITTIVDMPLNSIPPTTSLSGLEAKIREIEGKCHVDVALWGGAVPGNSSELVPMLRAGVLGFKCFLVDSGVPEFRNVEKDDLRLVLDIMAGTSAPLLVHAELAEWLRPPAGPGDKYETYLKSRPGAAEDQAIAMLYEMNVSSRARVHVVHLSSAGGLETIRRARNEGVPLTAETTPHYLHFSAESVPDGATEYKCAPPIRERSNRERLWSALEDGWIDCVVSDHSPCMPQLKHLESGDFTAAWGGIASLQLVLPVIWTEAEKRGIALDRLPRWLCEGPARLAGLSNKGKIAAGFDADLVVWKPESSFVVNPEALQHRHKITPYAGERLRGVVTKTFLRGAEICGSPRSVTRRGQWLRGDRA